MPQDLHALLLTILPPTAPADLDQVSRRHDGEIVPQWLSVPGVVSAERHMLVRRTGQAGGPPPDDVTFYRLKDPQVGDSRAFQRQLESHASGPALGPGDSAPLVWTQLPSPWEGHTALAASEGPASLLVIAQATPADDDRSMAQHAIPRWISLPGILACERFAATTAAGRPARLTLLRLASPEAADACAALEGQPPIDGLLWQGAYLQRPSPWTVRPLAKSH